MRLSEIISQIPDPQQYPLYRKLKAALRDGTLSAVPLTTHLTVYRATKPLTVPDHFILTDAETLTKWLTDAVNPNTKRATGAARYAVENPESLTPEELKRRADEYRASLQKTKGKSKGKSK